MKYFVFGFNRAESCQDDYTINDFLTKIDNDTSCIRGINLPNLSNLDKILLDCYTPLNIGYQCESCGSSVTKKLFIAQVGNNEKMYLEDSVWVQRNIGSLAKCNFKRSKPLIQNVLIEFKNILFVYTDIIDITQNYFEKYRPIYCWGESGVVLIGLSLDSSFI